MHLMFHAHTPSSGAVCSWSVRCQGGGVFDPESGLKIADFAGSIGANKLLNTMSMQPPKKNKRTKGEKPEEEVQEKPKEA